MRRCGVDVSIRKLFAIFIALAVLFAPAASTAAAAAMPGHDHMLMMDHSGRCQMPLGDQVGHRNKGDGKSCCVSMCMTVAVAPSVPGQVLPVRQQVAQFAFLRSSHGVPAEIATPPPRLA